jgi:ATP-independent RNA helicase DbpA
VDSTTDSFSQLPLSPAIKAALEQLEYRTMTPIQAASLPVALAGHDLIAQAKTGSGKTAAFALALLTNLNPRWFAVQAMVLCPTRELADQVTKEIRRLARFEDNIKVLALCRGTTMRPQMASLEHGAHIVVGTPGRIMDHLERGSLKLNALNTLVLDEADRMLDMGFYDDIAFVAKQCPANRQTLMFSATYPDGITRLAHQFMRTPQQIKLAERHESSKIRQRFYEIKHEERLQAVGTLLKHYRPVSTLAFCNTKQQCRDLLEVLHAQGFQALTLNGDLEQRERDQVLIQVANRSCSVLVATDVAARGLDITQLEAVINVAVTPDPEIHSHRIGRTGRGAAAAGRSQLGFFTAYHSSISRSKRRETDSAWWMRRMTSARSRATLSTFRLSRWFSADSGIVSVTMICSTGALSRRSIAGGHRIAWVAARRMLFAPRSWTVRAAGAAGG